MPTYNCSNCGQQFKGSEFIDECPNCSSENFQKVDPPVVSFFKKAWPFLIAIVVLAVAAPYVLPLLQQQNSTDSEKQGSKAQSVSYEIVFEQFDKGIAIKLEEWKKTGDGYNVNPLSKTKAATIIDELNFRASDNMGRRVTLQEGKFYPCPNDETDTLVIKWDKSDAYAIKDRQESKAVKYFTLEADEPHSEANCKMPKPSLKITNVAFSATNCILSVQTNRDESDDVMVSVTGKDGEYQAKNTWKASNIDEYDVWVSAGKDTIGYKLNGNPIGECVDCNQAKMKNIKAETKKAGNQYGEEPNNLSVLSKFKKQIDPSKTDFYLNGKQLGGWSDFYNKVKLRYENEGQQYKVTNVDVQKCKVQTVKFASK